MRPQSICWILLLTLPAPVFAHGDDAHGPPLHVDPRVRDCEVRFASSLTQEAYHRFVREFGSVAAFKQAGPPQTLGRRQVALSVEYIAFNIDDKSNAWNDTFVHPSATHELGSDLAFPKLRLRAGVSETTDIGLFFAKNPQSNYGWIGIDVLHTVLRQDSGMPVTVACRGAYTKTLFIDDMDMHALTGDLSVGRRLWAPFTAYVGAGCDWIAARETSGAVDLDTEFVEAGHLFAGAEVEWWHIALGAEAQWGAVRTTHLQASTRF
jgi:hypothetical protein